MRGGARVASDSEVIGSGFGKFFRSTLPLEFRGKALSITKAAGIMYVGRLFFKN